jgi:hypothetical protein
VYKKKTTEQIMKANLNKTLNRLKKTVADREELWLDFFGDLVPIVIGEEVRVYSWYQERIKLAGDLADTMLDAYESRWGVGSIQGGVEGKV